MARWSGRGVSARSAVAVFALVALLGCGVTGCGSQTSEPAASGPVESTAADHSGQAVTVGIRLAGGSVSPVNARAEARVGEPIELVVHSDTEDELHVHADPEHTFPVRAGADQRFTFRVDVPGRVDVELHEANVTVTTIYVRP